MNFQSESLSLSRHSNSSSSVSTSEAERSDIDESSTQNRLGRSRVGAMGRGLLDRLSGSRRFQKKKGVLDVLQNLRVRSNDAAITDDLTSAGSEAPSGASTTTSSYSSLNFQHGTNSKSSRNSSKKVPMKSQKHSIPSLMSGMSSTSSAHVRDFRTHDSKPFSGGSQRRDKQVQGPYYSSLLHVVHTGAPAHVVEHIVMQGSREEDNIEKISIDHALPLHCAIDRYDNSMEVLLRMLEVNPHVASIRNANGFHSVDLLWKRFMDPEDYRSDEVKRKSSVLRSHMEDVVMPKFCINRQSMAQCMLHECPELMEFWKIVTIFIQAACHPAKKVPYQSKLLHDCIEIECHVLLVQFAAALHPNQILEAVDNNRRLPLHIAAMKSLPIFKAVLGLNPRAAARQDESGRLPLHYAITSGKTWNDGVKDLIERYPESLKLQDPETGLPLYLLAASIQCPDLTTIYLLLLENPIIH
jgi:hypothetical protein